MSITELQTLLTTDADAFCQLAAPLTEAEFAHQPDGRWSVGDTAQHLYLSARPVLRLVTGHRDVFAQWGNAEGPSRTYDVIEKTYRKVLGQGVKAPANLSPRPEDVPADKATMLIRLTDTYLAIANQLEGWSDEELERYRIPHPALGLISVREMVYFIGIHTRHHMAVLQAY